LPSSSHRPRKRFGQHFLHDPGTLRRIIEAIDPAPGDDPAFLAIGGLTPEVTSNATPAPPVTYAGARERGGGGGGGGSW